MNTPHRSGGLLTAKTEVCILDLGYAPCNSEVVKYIPLELQGAYPRYGLHTSVFTVLDRVDRLSEVCSSA